MACGAETCTKVCRAAASRTKSPAGRGRPGAHECGLVDDGVEPPVLVELTPRVAVLGDPLGDPVQGWWASELDGIERDAPGDLQVAEPTATVEVRDRAFLRLAPVARQSRWSPLQRAVVGVAGQVVQHRGGVLDESFHAGRVDAGGGQCL